jgi:hypothetical protein
VRFEILNLLKNIGPVLFLLHFINFAYTKHAMEQLVEIPVTVRGVERTYPAKLLAWRYGMRFLVDLDGIEVTVERDDAGEFRAILPPEFTGKPPDKELISAIIQVLQEL